MAGWLAGTLNNLFMNVYVARNGETFGPYTPTQVQQYLDRGILLPSDQAMISGAANWFPITEVVQAFNASKRDVLRNSGRQAATPPIPSDCKRGIYIILGLFLGSVGVHNFYAGRLRYGAWQAFLMVTTGWTIIGAVLIVAFVIYELFTVTRDGDGRVMR